MKQQTMAYLAHIQLIEADNAALRARVEALEAALRDVLACDITWAFGVAETEGQVSDGDIARWEQAKKKAKDALASAPGDGA